MFKIISLSLLLYSVTFYHSLDAQALPEVLTIERWFSSLGLSPEAIISPRFERNLGETPEIVKIYYTNLTGIRGSSKKTKTKINDNLFLTFAFSTSVYDYHDPDGTLVPQPLQVIAFYGFEENKVSQYCLIEPLYKSFEPKIEVVKSMPLSTDNTLNTSIDSTLNLRFYTSQETGNMHEYYAMMDIGDKSVMLLDAYLSESAFEILKPQIVEHIRNAAGIIKRFNAHSS